METTENRIPKSTRQNPLTFYLRTLLYMIMALVMRAVAFAPLSALLIFPEGSYWRWLALLCPLLLIFFILPLRFSFAQALVQPARERRFSFDKATSVSRYGSKLGESLVHALNIFKWGIPLWLMLGAGYYFYSKTDAISLMKGVGDLGAVVVTVLYAVANFFIGIAGGTALVPNGGIMEGLYTIAAALGVGVLILLLGVIRNSAFRYIWALAVQNKQSPRAEARRRLNGRRGKQFWVAMVNLILWAPTLFVLFTTLKGMLSSLSDTLFNYVATKQLSLPELSDSIRPLIFAFAVCYLPLLPVRRILTAFFATKHLRHVVEESKPAPEQTPAAAPEQAKVIAKPETVLQPVFTPVQLPEQSKLEEQPEEIEPADEPANEPAPMPVYTPYTQPVAAAQPEPAHQTEPEPVKTAEFVYQPYQPATIVAEEQPAPVAQAEPVATPEPVYQPYQQETVAEEPQTATAESEPAAQPEADATAPLFTQEEPPADEDDYVKPYAPQTFDASEIVQPAAPADETDTDA